MGQLFFQRHHALSQNPCEFMDFPWLQCRKLFSAHRLAVRCYEATEGLHTPQILGLRQLGREESSKHRSCEITMLDPTAWTPYPGLKVLMSGHLAVTRLFNDNDGQVDHLGAQGKLRMSIKTA